jgi:diacylglycerol kinase (ATP)
MPRAFVVINPVSGIGDIRVFQTRLEQHFSQAGWDFTVYQTTGKENLKDIVRENIRQPYDMVVACGGDGTISQVASGLVGSGIPLGAIPLGTWNALARNMGIPIFTDEALRLLTGPHAEREIDGLEVNGNIYLINVSTGFSSSMIHSTRRVAKRRFGFLAYIWNLILQLVGLRRIGFHLVIDDRHRKVRAAELMVVNGGFIGLGELPTKFNIHPDDGVADVCIIKPRTIFGLLAVAWNILVRGKKRDPEFRYFSAHNSISIKTKKPRLVQGDGEEIGKTPVDIKVVQLAIKLIVPKSV